MRVYSTQSNNQTIEEIDIEQMIEQGFFNQTFWQVSQNQIEQDDCITIEDQEFFQQIKFRWDHDITQANQRLFSHQKFRFNQKGVINAALSGKDIITILPTGAGKSLTYQIPAIFSHNITLLVSPLKSLIYDQHQQLETLKIKNVVLMGNMSQQQYQKKIEFIKTYFSPLIIITTPEQITKQRVFNQTLKELGQANRISRIVIDEAHCIEEWGKTIRNSYAQLGELRQMLPKVPMHIMSATLTQKQIKSITLQLQLRDPMIFKGDLNRPNLHYSCIFKNEYYDAAVQQLKDWILRNHPKESGIIYCSRVDDTERLNQILESEFSTRPYHGKLRDKKRNQYQQEWQTNKRRIMICTTAFGMGINKPDVRFVVHFDLPLSMQQYYQESGRAGRDGNPASCLIMFSPSDIEKQQYLAQQGQNVEQKDQKINDLFNSAYYCLLQKKCRRQVLLDLIEANEQNISCNKTCDNCKKQKRCFKDDISNIIRIIAGRFRIDNRATGCFTVRQFINEFSKAETCNDEKLEKINAIRLLSKLRYKGYVVQGNFDREFKFDNKKLNKVKQFNYCFNRNAFYQLQCRDERIFKQRPIQQDDSIEVIEIDVFNDQINLSNSLDDEIQVIYDPYDIEEVPDYSALAQFNPPVQQYCLPSSVLSRKLQSYTIQSNGFNLLVQNQGMNLPQKRGRSNDVQFNNMSLKLSDKNSPRNLSSTYDSNNSAQRRWRKLKTVIHTVFILQNKEASLIDNIDEMIDDLKNSPTYPPEYNLGKRRSSSIDLLDDHKLMQQLFYLISRSSDNDLIEIERLIENHPKRFTRNKNDPDHFVNQQNLNGVRPLYEASRNGHLQTVRLLLVHGSDPHLQSSVGQEEENSLEVACRWGYTELVEVILLSSKWTLKELKRAKKLAQNYEIIQMIENHMPKRGIKSVLRKCCFC